MPREPHDTMDRGRATRIGELAASHEAGCCSSQRLRRRASRLGSYDRRWVGCRGVVGDRCGRRRRLGVDVLAVLALVGALVIGEFFAGAVITLMLASGRALEARAAARARHELQALLARAPRVVHRYAARELTEPALEDVVPGDLLLVRSGEVVPVDGRVEADVAVLDESALTGEPLPVERRAGDAVRSGVLNAGGPFDLRATTTARESTYAGIVRLVSEAKASTAPFVRLADRYAVLFLGVSLALAGVAWAVSGQLERAVAVLVVATPCPLILAAPVAIVAGISRAAHRGVVVKGGAALEQLAGRDPALRQDRHDHGRPPPRRRGGHDRQPPCR